MWPFTNRNKGQPPVSRPRRHWANTEELMWYTEASGGGYKTQLLVEKWVDMNSADLEFRYVRIGYDDGYYAYSKAIRRTVKEGDSDDYTGHPVREANMSSREYPVAFAVASSEAQTPPKTDS
jgi:hypothetical protein